MHKHASLTPWRIVVLALLLVLVDALPGAAGQLPQSPCPETFWYELDPQGGWHGVLRVVTPPWFSSLSITVSLASRHMLSSAHAASPGKLKLRGGEKAARMAVEEASQGRSYALLFDVELISVRQPTILNATADGRLICLELDAERPTNTIWLQYSLRSVLPLGSVPPGQMVNVGESPPSGPTRPQPIYPSVTFENQQPQQPLQPVYPQQPLYPQPIPITEEPYAPPPTPATAPPPPPTQRPRPTPPPIRPTRPPRPQTTSPSLSPSHVYADCGRDIQMPNQLVLNGPKAKPNSWPWHVAIYRKVRGATFSFNYQCGGTLVSVSFVLTAAHCVDRVKPADLITILGKYDVTSLTEKGQQTLQPDYVLSHPEYLNYLNDLAIVRLASPATITATVSTACLWSSSTELTAVVGQVGWVPGWGKDDSGQISAELRVAGMPIVSQETCLRSDNFYANYTSERTFCAGFRNGTSVCNGDSGGGLFLRSQDGKWLLRGIVSLAMTLPAIESCDAGSYVVFSDVAKFIPWIKNIIAALQPKQ